MASYQALYSKKQWVLEECSLATLDTGYTHVSFDYLRDDENRKRQVAIKQRLLIIGVPASISS